ncbi:MAG TPA: DsbA family protein [Acidimicrobiales bacterium]|jgi:2-hydroxychromene-2-carboxylate isomerase|nr:DsbA family protein [Actinomycetes bacterium]MDP6106066.1 DsbA family protein [Acidimicrobiales bacterium]MCP4843836.1 DsbA family protein [Actinomycetes bacterium]MDP6239878.1 DsbA family protein [Acidimicrobiales bacterium]MDP7124339.1 DsbA family protein [Acidimicrobiales bacterium]|tara:strand:- start:10189 stop:10887 length:699 start_codon:yes stop_codon:yes gene_type:complete
MPDAPAPTRVAFHFDVICPWAYQTSHWMREVRDRLGLEVDWRFFSLEEVNRIEGKKHPWEREWSYGWSMMRIGALLKREDPALNDAWYLKAGTALHVEGRKPHEPEVARHLLAEMDLDPSIVDEALADPTTHDDVRADHERIIGLGGWGVPTLVFPGADDDESLKLFGPVLIDPPTGEAADRLWNLVVGWLEFPQLYELQRPKTPTDLAAVGEVFRPYLEARDWNAVANPTP